MNKRWIRVAAILSVGSSVARADVSVVFTNDLSAREIDVPVTLHFSVDGSGQVTLDASTPSADPEAIAAVNGWDGPVGTLSSSNAFDSFFSLALTASTQTGTPRVNLSEIDPGGVGVAGQNSSRVDGGVIGNVETVRISVSAGAARVAFQSVSWNNSVNGVLMTAGVGEGTVTHTINNQPGTWTFADSGTNVIVATGESLDLSTASANGFALAGFAFDLITPPPPPPRTNALPNVVVILADDLGYSDISYNPHSAPEVSTPHIDRLIDEGVWFSNAYAAGNICAPSRTGFLTGSYQQRFGVHHEGDVNSAGFNPTTPIFPGHLKQQFDGVEDYVAKMVGKWHQGRDQDAAVSVDANGNGDFTDYGEDYGEAVPETMIYHPMRRGFDEVYGFIDLGGSSYWNYGRGFFDQYYRNEYETSVDGIADGEALETYLTTRFTEEACTFIETQSASNQPFFLYLSYNAVHTPMEAPPSPPGLSEGDPGWYPDAAWYDANFPNMWQSPGYSATGGQAADQATRAILMAMLYHMDQGIGKVVDTLKTTGAWDDTLVIFWSDNGGASASRASNHPLRERKHFNYEGGVRVPLSISWPNGLGAYSNTVVDAPVMSIDLLPTVLDAAEIEPLNGFDALDGKSLLPLIRGEVDNVHEALFWSEGGETGEYAVRRGDWKLYMDEDVTELYNLATDIGETTDLSGVYPATVRELRQALYGWMVEMTAAAGDTLQERLWIFETPVPTVGPANMVIEEFAYPAGPLAGSGGGSGWLDAWNGNGDMRVVTNSLLFGNPWYENGEPNGRSSDDETSVLPFSWKRTVAQPLTQGSVWLSWLSAWDPDQLDGPQSGSPADNAWQALLLNGDAGDSLVMFGGNGNRWSGAFDDAPLLDLRGNPVVPSLADAGSIFTDEHATYLHLVKLETNVAGTDDRITWYATSDTNGLTGAGVADLETAVAAGTLGKVVAVSGDGDWWGDALTALGIEVNNQPDSHLCDISFDNLRVVYGLDDDRSLAALLSGDTGEVGSLPNGFQVMSFHREQGLIEIEHDEKTGWYPSGVAYQVTDALTNPWGSATPMSFEQVDRYLDLSTFRAVFPSDPPTQFFRAVEE